MSLDQKVLSADGQDPPNWLPIEKILESLSGEGRAAALKWLEDRIPAEDVPAAIERLARREDSGCEVREEPGVGAKLDLVAGGGWTGPRQLVITAPAPTEANGPPSGGPANAGRPTQDTLAVPVPTTEEETP